MTKIDEIRQLFEAEGIRRVKLGGFDVDGILRGKYVRPEKFFSAAEKGLGYCDVIFGWDSNDQLYDNTKFTGWHSGYPDLDARIDLDTMRIVPWEEGVAAFLLDFDPEVCPRQGLKRVIAEIEKEGYTPKVGFEYEFFLFDEQPHELHAKGFRELRSLTPGMFGYSWLRSSQQSELVHDLMDGLEAFDIDLEGFHTETGPGVYEAAIGADDALAAADKAALFKTAVKEICSHHGVTACFMAKWSNAYPGCSGHIHQSLWREGENAFVGDDPDELYGMSKTMMHFLAGQLALMPELTVFYAPNINSYKRLVPGTWAPTSVTWGLENRTCAARVITGPGPKAMRVEMRLPGSDTNPYLALSASLASGLQGVRTQAVLMPETRGNGYEADEAPPLPENLQKATERLKGSRLAPQLLGEGLVDHFVRTREWEVREAQKAVTDWELKRYFELA
ncbi:MAG: glutamine synthetase family protein [Deltaproteobacteria bacterium]|nr:glutamine synthetase family protein [Deltaproteobacteria bacterium]